MQVVSKLKSSTKSGNQKGKAMKIKAVLVVLALAVGGSTIVPEAAFAPANAQEKQKRKQQGVKYFNPPRPSGVGCIQRCYNREACFRCQGIPSSCVSFCESRYGR